jgi:kumamolisin
LKNNVLGVLCLCLTFGAANAQDAAAPPIHFPDHSVPNGRVITPTASVERPEDVGVRMHTHYLLYVPDRPTADQLARMAAKKQVKSAQPSNDYDAETPASLACLYGLVAWTPGCNPVSLPNTAVSKLGSKNIAIVDAYDDPDAEADLGKYSAQFGLPAITASNFTKVKQSATAPTTPTDPNCTGTANAGNGWNCWEAEESLDIEMAHAMAPKAHIYLFEANSNSNQNLYTMVETAIKTLAAAGGGEISMSFGGSESAGETDVDAGLAGGKKVVLFASTGDRSGTEYPSVSPNVVAVGGTTINRDTSNGDVLAETAWENGGGGESEYEPAPSFQNSLGADWRLVPDVSAIANPNTPIWVYDSFDTPTGANAYLQTSSGGGRATWCFGRA